MTRFVLIRYDETHGRRSMSTPRGAQTLASADDLDELAAVAAAMVGQDMRALADGAGPEEVDDGA